MSKETTSTFLIKVTYSGPEKSFGQLFKEKASVIENDVTLKKSKTKEIASKPLYSDESKIIRNFLKNAAKDAGLSIGDRKKDYQKSGHYSLHYNSSRKHTSSSHHYYVIYLCSILLCISVENNDITISRYDCNKISFGPEDEKFSLADPQIHLLLVNYFKEWGKKY